ncbi:MAG TPA: outer membrane protein transport protein [Holophagaceae bacterium]|nr:outer membrane protein transport protein [Holophagaceae bacterium]
MTVSPRRSGSAFFFALVMGAALSAQTPQVPAADAVGVGRAGAGVAFGRSLEAASLNPALLPTLQDNLSVYVAAGLELQSAEITLQSNGLVAQTSDRNRFLGGFGMAWKPAADWGLGLKLDQPWSRHGLLPSDAPGRFFGRELDFSAHRLEAQVAYELPSHPGLSFGLGAGVTRVTFTGINAVRALVPQDGTQPASGANPVLGLVEQGLTETASATRPSFTAGLRWAVSTRWTLAATYQSAVTGDLAPEAALYGGPAYVGTNGYPPAPAGITTQGAAVLAASTLRPGAGTFKLPARATLGVRTRVNNLFTWEFDLRMQGAGLRMPAWAGLATPSGAASAPADLPESKRAFGFSAMGEVDLTKRLLVRGGIAYDGAYLADAQVNPVLGGQASALFSVGATYRVWGGELSAAYAYRQARDIVVQGGLDGAWDQSGFNPSQTPTRVEGMGHLISVGYKIAF